jgi:hypothetical protein
MSLSIGQQLAPPPPVLQASPAIQASLGVALRNILVSLSLSFFTLALTGFIWREQGYEMLIVSLGWPHVVLGFSFFFGRVLRGERDSRTTFLLLALATIIICALHYRYSLTGLIYLYFLFHLFRDEIYVYLQTRARHRPGPRVYAIAGIVPLILLILLIPRQEIFRHDLRRVEFTGAQISNNDWTLIPFNPVTNSLGRDFYFYLQAPHTDGLRAFVTRASADNSRTDGALIVGKSKWDQAEDLVFRPHYSGDPMALDSGAAATSRNIPILLTGGHSVGQTFRAERDNLDGVWVPIDRFEQSAESTRFVFHMASPPLLPYPATFDRLRQALVLVLIVLVGWRLIPRRSKGWQLWAYFAVLAGVFFGIQTILKSANNSGYPFPLVFQFAVVFHYWSWYVFSFDKLRVNSRRPMPANGAQRSYDRLLNYLGSKPHFTVIVIGLNVISILLVLWYYRLGGPASLRYLFDYNYFLYFLVFHVTFSFRPILRRTTS